eukprot:9206697-Ditylum_brightwellii.AAC.1
MKIQEQFLKITSFHLVSYSPHPLKKDKHGRPVRAKSRIVVLGNLEQHSWEKGKVYAPVITQPQVCLLISLAVSHKRVLKQADCRNVFCHSVPPKDET